MPFRSVTQRARRILRRVGVGAHAESRVLVRPAEKLDQRRREIGLDRRHLAAEDAARAAVDGDDVAFLDHLVADERDAHRHVDVDAFGSGHARLAHAPRDDGRVRSLAAAAGEDALRGEEPVDVLGLGLLAHQDDLRALLAQRLRAVRVEDRVAAGRSGRRRQPRRQRLALVLRIETREQHLLEVRRVDARDGFFTAQQPFLVHLDRGAHPRGGVHLAVARLQAIERAALDRELEVLHFAVVPLQPVAQLDQLHVETRHFRGEVADGLGRTDPCDHVLALRIRQVLAIQLVLARGRVAREADSGGAVVTHVAVDHGNDVDGRAVRHRRRDLELPPVVDGPLARPRVEDGLDGNLELLIRIGRERLPGVPLHHLQEAARRSRAARPRRASRPA